MTSSGRPTRIADRLKAWWTERLNNDSVRPWVSWYCLAWLTWAVLATTIFPPVTTIHEAMGSIAYGAWVWIAIFSNATPIIGLQMRHGGSAIADMSTLLLLRDWMGLILQACGHAVSCMLLLMFEVSVVITVASYRGPELYAGLTVFAGFMLSPWAVGTFMLCAQCLRKIQRGMQLAKRPG